MTVIVTPDDDESGDELDLVHEAIVADPEGWPNADELEDEWHHRDDEPVDDDRLDELATLEGWAQADDAWQPDDELVDETTAPDYDGAGTYADPPEDDD